MSYHTRETILVVLNAAVGFWYIVLSVGFFIILAQISRALQGQHDDPERKFPTWWVKSSRKVLAGGYIGTSLFLSGCGFHHLHLAFEVVPNAVDLSRQFHIPLHENLWVGDHFAHHFIIMLGQFVGAPLLMVSGGLAWLALRQRAKV